MKKKVLLVIGLYLCSMTVLAAAKDMSWSGWVSDSKCGAKGANASHEACAKKCIAAGEKPVLVTDKDQKVIAIDNPDALTRTCRPSCGSYRQNDRQWHASCR